MSISAAKSILSLAKFLPSRRTLISGRSGACLISRLGENTQNARTITRSLFYFSRSRDSTPDATSPFAVRSPWSNTCSCGCSVHTKGDKELVAFLDEEISSEKKAQRSEDLPMIQGFETQLDGSDVTFTKKFNAEVITVKANVNNSVDAEPTGSEQSDAKEQESQEMISKPDFTVEIEKHGKVLSFSCSYSNSDPEESTAETYDDSFQITEVALYSGDFEDKTYTISADIMDGYLYDLLMNYLEERGISNDFADKMVEFFTSYEHKLYIGLLKDMKKFVEK